MSFSTNIVALLSHRYAKLHPEQLILVDNSCVAKLKGVLMLLSKLANGKVKCIIYIRMGEVIITTSPLK